jgi:hypothetical protein
MWITLLALSHIPTGPTTTHTTNDGKEAGTPVTFSGEGTVPTLASPVTFSFA